MNWIETIASEINKTDRLPIEAVEVGTDEQATEAARASVAPEKLSNVRQRPEESARELLKTLHLLAGTSDPESFVRQIITGLLGLTEGRSGSFWQFDPTTQTSTLLVAVGSGPDSSPETLPNGALDPVVEGGNLHLNEVASESASSTVFVRIPLFVAEEFLGAFILALPPHCVFSSDVETVASTLAQLVVPVLRMARRAAEERLAVLQEERNLLACEVHDALAQHFAGILLQLSVAQRLADQQPEEAWHLVGQASALAQMAVADARRSVWALQPTAAEYRDLAATLSRTVTRMTTDTSLLSEVCVYGKPRLLTPDIGMNILRICQEALYNVLRHSGARRVVVELTFAEDHVRLCVQDDGKGFDQEGNQGKSGGFGLMAMQQRAERIGGRLAIYSRPKGGTEVAVTVPTGVVSVSETAPEEGGQL